MSQLVYQNKKLTSVNNKTIMSWKRSKDFILKGDVALKDRFNAINDGVRFKSPLEYTYGMNLFSRNNKGLKIIGQVVDNDNSGVTQQDFVTNTKRDKLKDTEVVCPKPRRINGLMLAPKDKHNKGNDRHIKVNRVSRGNPYDFGYIYYKHDNYDSEYFIKRLEDVIYGDSISPFCYSCFRKAELNMMFPILSAQLHTELKDDLKGILTDSTNYDIQTSSESYFLMIEKGNFVNSAHLRKEAKVFMKLCKLTFLDKDWIKDTFYNNSELFIRFIIALRGMDIVIIGSPHLKSLVAFSTIGFIEINEPYTANRYEIEDEIIRYSQKAFPVVFLFTTSLISNILIDDLQQIIGNNHFLIDCGNVWDFFAGCSVGELHDDLREEYMDFLPDGIKEFDEADIDSDGYDVEIDAGSDTDSSDSCEEKKIIEEINHLQIESDHSDSDTVIVVCSDDDNDSNNSGGISEYEIEVESDIEFEYSDSDNIQSV